MRDVGGPRGGDLGRCTLGEADGGETPDPSGHAKFKAADVGGGAGGGGGQSIVRSSGGDSDKSRLQNFQVCFDFELIWIKTDHMNIGNCSCVYSCSDMLQLFTLVIGQKEERWSDIQAVIRKINVEYPVFMMIHHLIKFLEDMLPAFALLPIILLSVTYTE